MTSEHHHSEHPYAARWRLLRRLYRHLNTFTYHLAGLCLKLVGLGYLLFCILFLVLRYVLLPNIGDYKGEIEHFLTASVGRPVSIAQLSGSWQGLRPSIELRQLTVLDEQGHNALVLPDVNVTISWLSLFFGQARFYDLEINHPELDLQRSSDGKIVVAGWRIDPKQKGDAQGLDWLLSQRQININNGVVHWTDAQRAAPPLTLSNVNFVLQNHWQAHTLSLSATPPAALSGPLDIRASFSHPAFAHQKSDYTRWTGLLYADFSKTDLAAWKPYVDYPFPVDQGNGAVRAWLTFDQARIVDFTADLKLVDVKALLRKDLPNLDLVQVAGRISVQEIVRQGFLPMLHPNSKESLLDTGHQIALTKLSFETRDGLRLPPTTLTEKYIPGSKTKAEQLEVAAQFVDLNVLTNLVEHFPMPGQYIDLLKNFAPAGQLTDLSVKLQGQYPKLAHYQIKGNFINLGLLPQPARPAVGNQSAMPAIPGISNLSGSLDVNERQGDVQLASKNLTLHLPEIMTEPDLHFDLLALHANWDLTPGRQLKTNLLSLDLVQDQMQAHFSGSHILPLNTAQNVIPHQALGILDLTGNVNRVELRKVGHYLPLGMQPDLYKWLSTGLEQGHVDDVTIRVKGDLAEFPFPKKGLLDPDLFYITGKIEDARLNYLPGVMHKDSANPYWPVLSKIYGRIVFDRENLQIDADTAETAGVPVTKVKAVVPDLYGSEVMLNIDGQASAPVQDLLHYVSMSPVLDWISNFTQDTHASGAARLKLRLELPLFHVIDAKVLADLQLLGNDINLIPDLPVLSQVSGHLAINERGLTLNGIHGSFLGGPVAVTGGSQKDNVIRIRADGQLLMDGVRKEYSQPELVPLLSRGQGALAYTALIQVKNKRTEIWADSTLQGVVMHLPAPMSKAAGDPLPMHFEMTAMPALSGAIAGMPERDELKLSLGKILNARYVRQRNADNEASHLVSGGIGINTAAPQPDSGVAASLNLTSLNVDELQSLIPASSAPQLAAGAPDSRHGGLALAPYVQIDKIAVHADDVTVMGKKLDQVVFGATRNNGDWQANIASRQISGRVSWSNTEQGLGLISARLSSLVIPAGGASDMADLLQNKTVTTSIPGLDIEADNLELFGKKLGRLELQAKNSRLAHTAGDNEWRIDKLVLTNADAVLTAQGKWAGGQGNAGTAQSTALSYQLDLTDAGKLLERFGYAQAVAGGKGRLSGDISWAGSPYALDIASLAGKIRLDLQSGQFLKVDPGAAKLLAVLNMQALPRRLLLDFRDVFSEGFAFDGITGDAQIEKGEARTDNLKMRGVAATVLLSGTADIEHETQNLHVVVVPEVNAGAASVVYALAVNPVIGVGTFLAQLFLREPLMKAFTFEYQITGPWKEPNVVKLGSGKHANPSAGDKDKQP